MENQYQKDYYVGSGSNYGKLPGGYNFLRRAIFWQGKIDIIKKYVQNGKVLDIGCSYGFFLYFLKKWFKIYGCDISSHAIGVCKKIFPNLPENRFWVQNIEQKLPFPKNYFNLIICMDVIEHIGDVLVPLKYIYTSLTRDGIFLLKIPIRTRYKIIEFLRFDNDPTHVSVLPERILISKIKKSGFEILEKKYYMMGFMPIPNFLNFGTDLLLVLKK
ncbi:MAG: methyltransferase domain-containing protein [Candidatus Lokiarchaeota archaeon]|nr:methyltransferase domain-containing protein [Candidatus Lokiarchaeota archaeon]MBD3200826.1 methyltransferase domain-containing protein [Candidatus Lokiarchaeota archaeon]